jgi:putative ABC transport system substrate-binding protein
VVKILAESAMVASLFDTELCHAYQLLLGLVLGATVFGIPAAAADTEKRTPTVALLNPSPPVPRFTQVIQETLQELGYEPGHNIIYLERWGGGREEQLRRDAAELVQLKVDVIAAGSSAGVRAATQATKVIPIVAVDLESDPLANGWVASLGRPGGNVTGFFLDLPELSGKRLEQLKEVIPGLSRVAVLWDPLLDPAALRATETSARALRLRLTILAVRRPDQLSDAFNAAVRKRAQAVLMMQSPTFDGSASQIAALAAQRRLPIAGVFSFLADAGFLLTYGPNVEDLTRRCWIYVDRILKGEKPSNLPVQRPGKFDLVLNLKTAKALGIKFPQTLMLQADRVIK